MPIKFRCRHCRQFLGISRAQAGGITDCPMCGKSIRVPNLDGSIDPIPSPELNLKDSQLVEALGELAEIGKSRSRAEVTSPPRISETFDATVIVPSSEPTPKAIPVPAAEPVDPGDSDTIIQGGNDGGTIADNDDPLRSLVESSPLLSKDGRSRRSRFDSKALWIAGITGALVLGVMAFMWMIGGNGSAPPVEAADNDSPPAAKADALVEATAQRSEHQTARPIGDAPSASEPAITGRVTYVADSGETVPDVGARVLLLPDLKPGTVKLDVAGFLAGAEQVDADVARAAIRAMGGELATADENGDYQISASEAGDYQLLVISRHRAREPMTTVDTQLQEILSTYFFRPASLLGSLSFQTETFAYHGQGPSTRDVRFAAE